MELFRGLHDDVGLAQALAMLGNLLALGGDHRLARELHEESLALHEAAADARGIGLSLLAIGIAAGAAGEGERAWEAVQRALAIFDRSDDVITKIYRGQQLVIFGRYEKGGPAVLKDLSKLR